ncbi:hypothetical protein AAC387_Pa02g1966 [Persea americana]
MTELEENPLIPDLVVTPLPRRSGRIVTPPDKFSFLGESYEVWTLMDLPGNIKPIRCKWVYKRKRGPDGRVETFKARFVVKWYTQKEGIDYKETFVLVAMLKSIRILLSIAAHLEYEIWQMDVKMAFLNGHLEEDIYIMQPDGFVAKNQE